MLAALLFPCALAGPLATTPIWEAVGEYGDGGLGVDGAFGIHAALGDVDGDGAADLLVSDPAADGGTTGHYEDYYAGRVYRYAGTGTGPSAAATDVLSPSGNGRFGASLANAGDMDGDGLDDIAIGATDGAGSYGYVQLYFGDTVEWGTADWRYQGSESGEGFANALAAAGDTDGDGYADLLAGSYLYGDYEGRAVLFPGGATGPTTPAWQVEGALRGGFLGSCVSGVGDIDGDGRDDVTIGALYATRGWTDDDGQVWLYLGASGGLDGTAAWETVGERLDHRGCGTGADLAADGAMDLILPAYSHWDGASHVGHLDVFPVSGGVPVDEPTTTLEGCSGCYLGYGLAVADFDADGLPDIASNTRLGPAAVFVWRGRATGVESTYAWSWEPAVADSSLKVTGAGDLDGDGIADLVVGADDYTSTLTEQGAAWVFMGEQAVDGDGDGFLGAADCDETDATVHDGALDTPGDGVDQDCDGTDAGEGEDSAAPVDTGETGTETAEPEDTDTAEPADTDTDSGAEGTKEDGESESGGACDSSGAPLPGILGVVAALIASRARRTRRS